MTAETISLRTLRRPARPVVRTGLDLSGERLRRTVRLGVRSLWLHRLRSFLTVLGIVFGVCSVIAMLAIGEGVSYEVQEQIRSLGSQNIILRSIKPPEEQKISERSNQSFLLVYGLTHLDLKRIKSTIPGVDVVVPGRIKRDDVWNISRRLGCEIMGTVPWYPQTRNQHVARGRFFTDSEMDEKAAVCVLGAEVAETLFPLSSPVGSDVRVGADYFRVIGVMEAASKGPKTAEATDNAKDSGGKRIFIPLETAKTRYGDTSFRARAGSQEAERVELHELTIRVTDRDQVVNVSQAIKELMEKNHQKKDYEMVVPLELLRRAERDRKSVV